MAKENLDVDELIDLAWDASTDAFREKFARQALKIDPEVIDAYNLLALCDRPQAEKIELLEEAVALGKRQWAAQIGGRRSIPSGSTSRPGHSCGRLIILPYCCGKPAA
jgi:hypothetical protein